MDHSPVHMPFSPRSLTSSLPSACHIVASAINLAASDGIPHGIPQMNTIPQRADLLHTQLELGNPGSICGLNVFDSASSFATSMEQNFLQATASVQLSAIVVTCVDRTWIVSAPHERIQHLLCACSQQTGITSMQFSICFLQHVYPACKTSQLFLACFCASKHRPASSFVDRHLQIHGIQEGILWI